MAKFKYKAIKPSGEAYEAVGDFADKFALYRELKASGDTVLHAEEASNKPAWNFRNLKLPFFGGVKIQEKVTFARNLGAMIEAGLSLSRALGVIEKQTRNAKFKKIVSEILSRISKGKELSESLSEFPDVFPALFVSMVRSGEQSGTLSRSLKVVGEEMQNTYNLEKKIKGALIYPGVIMGLIIVIATIMLVYVVPSISKTFVELHVDLPLSTRIIIAISDFFQANIISIAIFTPLIILGGFYALKTAKGKRLLDSVILRMPILGEMSREINSARTGRTLSTLLLSGVDIVMAIGIVIDVVQNTYYKDILGEVKKCVEKGSPISEVFSKNEDLYPVFVGEMVAVGEETGKLGNMLSGVADFYEAEVDRKTKDMSSIIEPVLMIIIGVAVGFFALAMISPTYSLVNVI